MSRQTRAGKTAKTLEARLQQVESMMRNMSTSARPRSRSRRRDQRPRSRSRPRSSSRQSRATSAAAIRVVHSELLVNIQLAADKDTVSGYVELVPDSTTSLAGHFKALGNIYERFQWHSCTLEYFGAVGSTVGGVVAIGIDYDQDTKLTIDLPAIVAMSPNAQVAAWKKVSIRVPATRMQAQKWVSTEVAHINEGFLGKLGFYASCPDSKGKLLGYVKLHYDVTFSGPRKP